MNRHSQQRIGTVILGQTHRNGRRYTEFVMLRAAPIWLVVSLPLVAQPPKPTDYATRTKLSGIELGARYLPHGLPSDAAVYAPKKFLIVDVGVFPQTKNGLTISKSQFTLSVDGKVMLTAQTPGAASSRESLSASRDSSSSDSAVQLGGPPIPTPSSNKARELESMPRRPISLDTEQPPTSAPTIKAALPEGSTNKPVSGYLFFRFDGDPKSIRSLELTYTAPSGAKTKIRIL